MLAVKGGPVLDLRVERECCPDPKLDTFGVQTLSHAESVGQCSTVFGGSITGSVPGNAASNGTTWVLGEEVRSDQGASVRKVQHTARTKHCKAYQRTASGAT